MNKYLLLLCAFALSCYACSSDGNDSLTQPDDNTTETTVTVAPVTNLEAHITQNPNELYLTWKNPTNVKDMIGVEISYRPETSAEEQTVNRIQTGEGYTLRLPDAKTYSISVRVVDNFGRKSAPVSILATPSETGVPLADSCTYVLIEQFMDKSKGTFWKSPKNVNPDAYIYWQQAHAIDVVLYAYERIRSSHPTLAATYKTYFERWYANHANNYHHDPNDATGFANPFTDDMCWIGLTLLRMSEALGDDKFADTAKQLYDSYIIPRAWTDDKGTGLPWKNDDKSRNTCTNSPGCLLAAKLYRKYGASNYLSDATTLYQFAVNNLLKADGRMEEPPLTYTQGTFGEACRQLYHITGESAYMQQAEKVIGYATTSSRCLRNGILRDEGTSMDQSIFKAVFVPYAVNLALDEAADATLRQNLILFLRKNAEVLSTHLVRGAYPEMYCNYYWGETFGGGTASMGAQASGASLMEGVVRMNRALEK